MIDNRMYTFLELCDVMNYHKTAQNLNMTQPAVTQHIKYLEQFYGCKLFAYQNKQLHKTAKGIALEKYTRSIVSLSRSAQNALAAQEKLPLKIGATKTIGEYLLDDAMLSLLSQPQYELQLVIDNTERLLEQLNHFALDLLLLEGYVDKQKYQCQSISTERIVGICAQNHPFAGKQIPLEEIFAEHLVLREQGSGTRAVLEHFLTSKGYSVEKFARKSSLSSNRLIERAVGNGLAISFVYEVIAQKNKNLATFQIKGSEIFHELNYVFLNQAKVAHTIALVEQAR